MSNLYQDAILDAKALRASAMANAKAALEEAFEPKIKEMVQSKLAEDLDETEELEEMYDDQVEETYHEDGQMEENADINEAELEEILAQLEELSQVNEEDDQMEEEALNEAEEEEDKEEEEEGGEEASEEDDVVGDDTKIIDITLGDLKQVLQSAMAGGSQDMPDMEEPTADSEAESEISLDEILAELEEDDNLEEADEPELEEADETIEEVDQELEEARATIETLRQNLQEVNLLNAKYLYMNKLFKAKTLTESQKVKIVNALDRATNVAEVKNTYETLKESLESSKKPLKESIGFASQSAGIAPKKPIIEQDNMINRWQKLAGIK